MTTVVHISKSKYDVYIGRTGKGQDGYFGNSHNIGFCLKCKKLHSRDECVSYFKKDFLERMKTDPEYKKRVDELKNKVLGCFCKPKNCHGDVYVEYHDKK